MSDAIINANSPYLKSREELLRMYLQQSKEADALREKVMSLESDMMIFRRLAYIGSIIAVVILVWRAI